LPQKYSRQRKVPARLKKTSKSAREDDEVLTSEEYHRGRTYYTFLDRLRQELERRFLQEREDSGHGDVTAETQWKQWKDIGQCVDTAHSLCEFYRLQGEETNLQTELRVFHASYKCPKRSMLEAFKENNANVIFQHYSNYMPLYSCPL